MHIGARRFSIFRTEFLSGHEEWSKLAGVIYIHCISDERFDRIIGLDLKMACELCSNSKPKNLVFVSSAWDEVSRDIGEAHESRLSSGAFGVFLGLGAHIVRHDNTAQSAHNIIRRITESRSAASRIQREDIVDTATLEADNRRLSEQIRQYRAELEEVRETMHVLKGKDEEMVRALREKDEEMMQVLKEAEAAVAQALKEKDEEMM